MSIVEVEDRAFRWLLALGLAMADALAAAVSLVAFVAVRWDTTSRADDRLRNVANDIALRTQQAMADYRQDVHDFRIMLAVFAGVVLVLATLAAAAHRTGHDGVVRGQWLVAVAALFVLAMVAAEFHPVRPADDTPAPPTNSHGYCSGGTCPPGLS